MADLTLTLTESLNLNGYDQGGTSTKIITGITESSKRIVRLFDTVDTTLLEFGITLGSGKFLTDNVKYVRITNLGKNEEVINVSLGSGTDGGSGEVIIDLEPGYFFVLSKVDDVFEVFESGGTPTTSLDVNTIKAKSELSSVDLEIFVASG
tara:strand:+ start:550 stop:1002 length:453 start_codon:yes stop_codon:yes gene_type:complete